jgi:hypothetical protein
MEGYLIIIFPTLNGPEPILMLILFFIPGSLSLIFSLIFYYFTYNFIILLKDLPGFKGINLIFDEDKNLFFRNI